MTSTISPSAIHRVIFLVENDDRPTFAKEKKRQLRQRPTPWHLLPAHCYADHSPNSAWKAIYKLYLDIKPAPPLDYLVSFELTLILKEEADDEDAFSELHQEPSCVDVTITPLFGLGPITPSEAWPQVYTTLLPCHACTTVETIEERSLPHLRGPNSENSGATLDFAVEKFHISSARFSKRLTVVLRYLLEDGEEEEADLEQSSVLRKITIRLDNETCSARGRLSGNANRSRTTLVLLPDFASEVFGFLDRAHIGASLIANRSLHDVILQLTKCLPVHHLTCAFEKERFHQVYVLRVGGAYWLEIRHILRDLSYVITRHFKIPSTAGAENDCDLIRGYLGNSHVADLQAPADFTFAFKMLASLAARNCSIGRLELGAEVTRFSDYRSMAIIFGGMRISDVYLRCEEHRFVELVKTTDFFRMPTVNRLRKLKLTLCKPSSDEPKPRGHARSKRPLWVSGIYLLPNCAYYGVDYWSDRHLRFIERKMVKICEEFERGTTTDIVDHFQLKLAKRINYAFKRGNLLISGLKVEGDRPWDRIKNFEWDIYRFRNARTSEHLTACVGRDISFNNTLSILHIVKGEVYPDASFATY